MASTSCPIMNSKQTKRNLSIRTYRPNEDDWLLVWGGQHAFTELAPTETFNEHHFLTTWKQIIANNTGQIYFVQQQPQCLQQPTVVGAIGIIVDTDLFTATRRALLAFWFLLPQARGTLAAARLIKQFIRFAEENDCRQLTVISLERFQNESKVVPYLRRLGFAGSGRVYSRDL